MLSDLRTLLFNDFLISHFYFNLSSQSDVILLPSFIYWKCHIALVADITHNYRKLIKMRQYCNLMTASNTLQIAAAKYMHTSDAVRVGLLVPTKHCTFTEITAFSVLQPKPIYTLPARMFTPSLQTYPRSPTQAQGRQSWSSSGVFYAMSRSVSFIVSES